MCLDRPTLHIRGVGLAQITATWKQEHTLVFPPITVQNCGVTDIRNTANCFSVFGFFFWFYYFCIWPFIDTPLAFSLMECGSVDMNRERRSHLFQAPTDLGIFPSKSLDNLLVYRMTDLICHFPYFFKMCKVWLFFLDSGGKVIMPFTDHEIYKICTWIEMYPFSWKDQWLWLYSSEFII